VDQYGWKTEFPNSFSFLLSKLNMLRVRVYGIADGKRVLSLALCEETILVGQDYCKFFKFLDTLRRNVQCVRKVAVHLYKVLKVMSTSVCTGPNLFNFIRKHFPQICVRK
jgi:hypothetical protein